MSEVNAQRYSIQILAEDFGEMPQGADLLADGRFLSVDVQAGEIVAFSVAAGREVIGKVSSGPIGITRGSDGAFYLAHTGGRIGDFWAADDQIQPCIQKLSANGKVLETLLIEVEGEPLIAPHDICFGADGRLYFTDSHIWEWEPGKRRGEGRIIALAADGRAEVVARTGVAFPCGITGEPDGSIVWTESYTEKLRRLRADGQVEEIVTLPDGHTPHGVRVGADGTLWVASFGSSTLDEITPDGSRVVSHPVPGHPMNIAFDGDDLIVATFKVVDENNMDGRLLRFAAGMTGATTPRGHVGA